MYRLQTRLIVLGTILLLALTGCSSEPEHPALDPCDGPGVRTKKCGLLVTDDVARNISDDELRWEARTRLAPTSTYDKEVSDNVWLVLSYDSTANAFIGTLRNRNQDPLLRVRAEVRLDGSADRSAHITLVDLASSQVKEVTLPVDSDPFTFWQVLTDVETLNRIHGHP